MEYGANVVSPSKLWAEIKPQIGKMINACSNLESSFKKARSEAYDKGFNDGLANRRELCENYKERKQAEEKAYQQGRDDIWELVKAIVLPATSNGYSNLELNEIFGTSDYFEILTKFSAIEVAEKICIYEEEKERADQKIKVGDEVMLQMDHEEKGICIGKQDNKMQVMWSDGSAGEWEERDFIKTGRHFPEIAEVLQKLESTN